MIMKRTILLCLPTILLLGACHQNTNQANTTKIRQQLFRLLQVSLLQQLRSSQQAAPHRRKRIKK